MQLGGSFAVAFLPFAVAAILVGCDGGDPEVGSCDESPGALYERRVAPLLREDHPNTCAECHAGGLDLASFLRPDPCESMACLVEQGLVSLDSPESSVLLAWIERSEPSSELVTPAIVEEERQGFLEWIEHEAECRACSDTKCPEPTEARCGEDARLPSAYDVETDPGDCDAETLERLFRGTVYEQRGRCYPCHFVEREEAPEDAPRWATEIGACEVAALSTQRRIVDAGYVDTNDPERSLFLLKPLGDVPHGGHAKFVRGDSGYEAFAHWVSRYAACENE